MDPGAQLSAEQGQGARPWRGRRAAAGTAGHLGPGSSRPRARCYATTAAAAAPSAAMASLRTASPELRAYFSRHNLLDVYEVTAADPAKAGG